MQWLKSVHRLVEFHIRVGVPAGLPRRLLPDVVDSVIHLGKVLVYNPLNLLVLELLMDLESHNLRGKIVQELSLTLDDAVHGSYLAISVEDLVISVLEFFRHLLRKADAAFGQIFTAMSNVFS